MEKRLAMKSAQVCYDALLSGASEAYNTCTKQRYNHDTVLCVCMCVDVHQDQGGGSYGGGG